MPRGYIGVIHVGLDAEIDTVIIRYCILFTECFTLASGAVVPLCAEQGLTCHDHHVHAGLEENCFHARFTTLRAESVQMPNHLSRSQPQLRRRIQIGHGRGRSKKNEIDACIAHADLSD